MIKNRDSLKAKAYNLYKKTNIPNKYLIQDFMFEALLKRISMSIYKEKFIIKGATLTRLRRSKICLPVNEIQIMNI